MRKTYEIHRLTTTNAVNGATIHDFSDIAALAIWWKQNASTAGASIHQKLTVTVSLVAVYPIQQAPSVPSGNIPSLAESNATIRQHSYGSTTFPTVG